METIGNFKKQAFNELNFRVTLVTMMEQRGLICSVERHQEAANVAQVANGRLNLVDGTGDGRKSMHHDVLS